MLCRLGGVGLGRLILERVLLNSVSGERVRGKGRRTVVQTANQTSNPRFSSLSCTDRQK